MANPWTEQRIHFIDFEGNIASGIVEYGVVEMGGSQIVALHTRLCRPTGRLRIEDVAVHGLDEAALAGATPLAEDFAQFADWRETGPLAAHFAGAENSLIKSVWPYPRIAPDFARPRQSSTEWGPWIDTGALYRQARPGLATYGLAELVVACGLQGAVDAVAAEFCPTERRRYHAAPYDALAGAVLLRALAAEPAWAKLSVGQLLALSTLDGGKRDALQQRDLFD